MEKERVRKFFENKLVNNIYKILPLFEECNLGLNDYIDSLIKELEGVSTYLSIDDLTVISLIGVLKSLSEINVDTEHQYVKREVFKAIKLSKSIAEGMM